MGRINEYRIARTVLMAEVSEGWVRGRPRLGRMDAVKLALSNRGMTKDRKSNRVENDERSFNARKIERVESPGTCVTE